MGLRKTVAAAEARAAEAKAAAAAASTAASASPDDGSASASHATALTSAARGASYNIVLQICFRVLTFVVNAVILRETSGEMLGVVNVRLMLLYTTLLFVTREPFRKAGLSFRRDERDPAAWRRLLNLMWLCLPLGLALALGLAQIWLRLLERPAIPGYAEAVLVFAGCGVFELASEPVWLLAMVTHHVRLKVVAEGLALAARCGLTVVLLTLRPELGLWAFCYAQMAHALVLVAVYYGYMATQLRPGGALVLTSPGQLLPCLRQPPGLSDRSLLPAHLLLLCTGFFKQSLLKQLLTEGERYVMTFFNVLTFAEQGVFDVVTNLGALAARFLFQPIEENYYTFFAGLLEREETTARSERERRKIVDNHCLAAATLQTLMTLVTLLGLIIFVFSQAYSDLLLSLYGGSVLSEGPGPFILRAYAGYVFLLAINGVSECFAFAAMSKLEVERHNWWLLFFSVSFLATSLLCTSVLQMGAIGFIVANAINMLCRIQRSVSFIGRYFQRHEEVVEAQGNPLEAFWPSVPVLATFLLSLASTLASKRLLYEPATGAAGVAAHVGVGAVCGLVCLAMVFLRERPFLNALVDLWRGRRERTGSAGSISDKEADKEKVH